MIPQPEGIGRARGICGRWNHGPWLPHRAYVIRAGLWYREWRPGRLWDRLHDLQSIYVCRLPVGHPVRVLRQARTVMKEVVWDHQGKSRLKRSVRSRVAQRLNTDVRRTQELWPVEYPSVETGHLYVLARVE